MMLMMLAAAFSLALPEHPVVNRSLTGLQVGVIGLLAASMWRLARSEAKDTARLMILVACAVLGFFFNAALVIAAAGLVGMLMSKESSRA
jgi:chromate transport protein ChrA